MEHTKDLPNRQGVYAFGEKNLWQLVIRNSEKILINKDIKKKDLGTMAGISSATLAVRISAIIRILSRVMQ